MQKGGGKFGVRAGDISEKKIGAVIGAVIGEIGAVIGEVLGKRLVRMCERLGKLGVVLGRGVARNWGGDLKKTGMPKIFWG